MPKKNHKGQARHFITSAEELEAEQQQQQQADASTSARLPVPETDEKKDEEEEEDPDDDSNKHKGVSHLIEVANPNRVVQKPKKASEIGQSETASRRQREQQDADRLRQQAERKQVEADLARLAIIRKQRDEEERKLAEAKKLKELRGQQQQGSSTSPPGATSKR